MTINLSLPQKESEIKPRITVIGVGGAGGNAVNNMISAALEGVEFIVANTDAQALGQSLADRRVQLGITITQGLGAGARPEVGRQAAEEALPEILQLLDGANMVFVTAGMGGGTGTGAAPVIAAAAREQGILTIGVVTKPFHFEGRRRMQSAEQGITELEKVVDTLIVIPNQNLFKIANEKTTFADAFKMADDVLHMGVRGVTDLMVMPGLINLDFADIRTVMGEMGKAMMGTGEAEGPDRSRVAAESGDLQPAAGRPFDEGRQGRSHQHHRRPRHDAARGRRGGQPHPRGSRRRRQHHLRLDLRCHDAGPHARVGGRHRHRRHGGAAAGAELPLARHEPADADRSAGAQPSGHAAGRPRRHADRGDGGSAAPMPAAPSPRLPWRQRPAPPPVAAAAPPAPPMMAPAPMAAVAEAAAAPIAEAPIPAQIMAAPPVEAPAAPIAGSGTHRGASPGACRSDRGDAPAPAPAAAPAQRPLVDENDWRVSRPPMKAAGARAEPIARPMAARPAGGDSRSPNLFQRITGAFSAPKPATAAAPAEPPAAPCGAGKRRGRRAEAALSGRHRSRPRSASTSPSGPSPRAMTTTCKFPRSCVGKPTDAGFSRSPRILSRGRSAPLFLASA